MGVLTLGNPIRQNCFSMRKSVALTRSSAPTWKRTFEEPINQEQRQNERSVVSSALPPEIIVPLIPIILSTADTRSLKEFLDSPNRPDGTLRFHELQGFLFAIASSPETISPSEWLPLISNDKDMGYRDENEAQQVLNWIMALFNEVNTTVLERSDKLPRGCEFKEEIFANFDVKASISQWSGGFMIGHDWLSELWDDALPKEMDEECGATTMVLTFFSSQQLAKAYFEDGKPWPNVSGKTFEDFSETARKLFPSALASYAHLGRTIFEVLFENAESDRILH